MVELADLDVMAVLAAATNTIAEGEVMQLANIGNCEMSEAYYREVIRCKTALLFEAAAHTGALLATASQTTYKPLKHCDASGSISASHISSLMIGWTTLATAS